MLRGEGCRYIMMWYGAGLARIESSGIFSINLLRYQFVCKT